jgi:hypothetical protein
VIAAERIICDREEALLEVVRAGRWPELCGAELSAHIAACGSCAELVAVASALASEHQFAMHEAPVPGSGMVWWRMQKRAREEAVRAANRAVTTIQAVSIAAGVIIAMVIIGTFANVGSLLQSAKTFLTVDAVHLPAASAAFHWSLPLALALLTCFALAPVALYLAFARD